MIVVPWPETELICSSPPNCAAHPCAAFRPRPVPPDTPLVVKNGVVDCRPISSDMPQPVSIKIVGNPRTEVVRTNACGDSQCAKVVIDGVRVDARQLRGRAERRQRRGDRELIAATRRCGIRCKQRRQGCQRFAALEDQDAAHSFRCKDGEIVGTRQGARSRAGLCCVCHESLKKQPAAFDTERQRLPRSVSGSLGVRSHLGARLHLRRGRYV